MPPRKEPKESVVYPSSKRKTPAFKPLRPGPSKVARTESATSVKSTSKTTAAKKPTPKKTAKPTNTIAVSDSEEDEDGFGDLTKGKSGAGSEDEDDSETLEDDPLATTTTTRRKPIKSAAPPTRRRDDSPMSISSHAPDEPVPSQSDPIPSIPQPLLIRLLHEAFVDKNTRIDTHAIQVLQKYVEIFVREAIARTEAGKREKVEKGECAEVDGGWLEVEDLEGVVAGLLLEF